MAWGGRQTEDSTTGNMKTFHYKRVPCVHLCSSDFDCRSQSRGKHQNFWCKNCVPEKLVWWAKGWKLSSNPQNNSFLPMIPKYSFIPKEKSCVTIMCQPHFSCDSHMLKIRALLRSLHPPPLLTIFLHKAQQWVAPTSARYHILGTLW